MVAPVPSVVGREMRRDPDGQRGYFPFCVPPFGSLAERALVLRQGFVPLPDDVDAGAAVGVGTAGLAAWIPLTRVARLSEGEKILVLGASGAVGQLAVQLARILGAGRIGRSVERNRRSLAMDLGADAATGLTPEEPRTRQTEAMTSSSTCFGGSRPWRRSARSRRGDAWSRSVMPRDQRPPSRPPRFVPAARRLPGTRPGSWSPRPFVPHTSSSSTTCDADNLRSTSSATHSRTPRTPGSARRRARTASSSSPRVSERSVAGPPKRRLANEHEDRRQAAVLCELDDVDPGDLPVADPQDGAAGVDDPPGEASPPVM